MALPADAKISLEKSSPVLNKDTGSFSYPFPAPRLPNEKALGWPGKLQRVGDIEDKSFVLADQGIQVLRGEVDFDEVTAREIGLILKSGMTEFYARMEGLTLPKLDFGNEAWLPEITTEAQMLALLQRWDGYNAAANSPIVLGRVRLKNTNGGDDQGNITHYTTGLLATNLATLLADGHGYYQLQFKIWWVVEQIFEKAGYTIVSDAFKPSDLGQRAILFGNVLTALIFPSGVAGSYYVRPVMDVLNYASMMPDVDVADFLEAIANMFCLVFDIDERRKEVAVGFKKVIFLPENLSTMPIKELAGWVHTEEKAKDGFVIKYQGQASEMDTQANYSITQTVGTTLPAPTAEGEVYHVTDQNRDFIVLKDEQDALYWQRIGRLRGYYHLNGDDETEIAVTVPANSSGVYDSYPDLNIQASLWKDSFISQLSGVTVSLFHGTKTVGGIPFVLISADDLHIDVVAPGSPIELGMSLKPAYLYETVYSEWLNWHYRTRKFTKYLQLSLTDLVKLSWRKRYVVNGIQFILNKVNYELPHKGTVKIEGYTA